MIIWLRICLVQRYSLITGELGPKHVGVLKIKTLYFIHIVGLIYKNYITIHGVKKVKKKMKTAFSFYILNLKIQETKLHFC